ncbi:hypothetical protein ARSEF4850_007180 [Beauveria asiatica]
MPRNPTVLVYTWAQVGEALGACNVAQPLVKSILLWWQLTRSSPPWLTNSDKHAANDDSEAALPGRGGGTATAARSRYRHRAPTRARKDLEDLEAAEKADVSSIQQGM